LKNLKTDDSLRKLGEGKKRKAGKKFRKGWRESQEETPKTLRETRGGGSPEPRGGRGGKGKRGKVRKRDPSQRYRRKKRGPGKRGGWKGKGK